MAVFLHATYQDVALRVRTPTSIAAPTLRRERTTDSWVRVQRGVPCDVGLTLGVAEDVARRAVLTSPDYLHLTRLGLLVLAPVPAPATEPAPATVPEPAIRHEVIEVPTLMSPPPRPAPPPMKIEETDVTPTMRWSRGHLEDHARALGLDVDETWTKTRLLRAIRAR